jgi:hypothetical protein
MRGSLQWKSAARRAAIITEQILHRSTKQGARAAPFFFVAMSATLNCVRIGETRSKLRAFDAGSGALLPVFCRQILSAIPTLAHRARGGDDFTRFLQEPSREHRRHTRN